MEKILFYGQTLIFIEVFPLFSFVFVCRCKSKKKNDYQIAIARTDMLKIFLARRRRITYWESQIFAICYGSAQISSTVPLTESSGSSGGSRGAEPQSRWPGQVV
jgi:hypothetical protein